VSADHKDLSLLLDSKVPLLVIESYEEPRVLEMITRLAVARAMPLYTWSVTEGLSRLGFGNDPGGEVDTAEPAKLLRDIKSTPQSGIYVLCDFHPYIKDEPVNVRLLREICMRYHQLGHTVVLLSHRVELPGELKRYCARFELAMPTEEQLINLVREEANNWSRSQSGQPVRSDSETFRKLVESLRGLSLQDARKLVRGAIWDDGAIKESDLPELNRAKFALMDMDGVLSFEYDTASFSEVAGLRRLKHWLKTRADAFNGEDTTGLDAPKGIMLLGIQGSGKSLAAKAVAGMWCLPLLRLDFGSLYNKFYGESERNLREALRLSEQMSPCVLWLDEIEKGISVDTSDGGTSQRMLGTLLTWMSERQSKVFLVATSNDISRLPPELVRKGRLDEIFFVDLPGKDVRAEVFKIHLQKRDQRPEQFDLQRLAELAEGFSGAEIEQSIVSALYTVSAMEESLTMTDIENAINNTNPLSVVMFEKVQALRQWARERCVFTD
jgi:SpoVK/Ycf46/Vps4 family AAA+-type ATPase